MLMFNKRPPKEHQYDVERRKQRWLKIWRLPTGEKEKIVWRS